MKSLAMLPVSGPITAQALGSMCFRSGFRKSVPLGALRITSRPGGSDRKKATHEKRLVFGSR